MQINYTQVEKKAVDFFVKYEFVDGILEMLDKYILSCREHKKDETKGVDALTIFNFLNSQLKQWHVSGAYNEDVYWYGRGLLEDIYYD